MADVIRPHSFQQNPAVAVLSCGGPAGTAVGRESPAVPAPPIVRSKIMGWTGRLLGFGKKLGEYQVAWDGLPDVYTVQADRIEIDHEPNASHDHLLWRLSAAMATLEKLQRDVAGISRLIDQDLLKLRANREPF